jgi:hypothetical protein
VRLRRAAAAAVALATVVLPTVLTAPIRSAAAEPVGITLASQSPWVSSGQNFQLRFGLTTATNSGSITATVYGAVPNRSEFVRTLANKIDELPVGPPLSAPISALVPDAAGARAIAIGVQDPTKPRDRSRLVLPRSGVYPVRVQYQPDDHSSPSVFVTHLLYLSGPITGGRLNVAWVVPVSVPPNPGPDGSTTITSDESDRLAALASALDTNRDVPVVLKPTPDTVAALAASGRPQDRATLSSLALPVATRQVVASTYAPVSLPGLLGAGLAGEATNQLTRGSDVLASTLNIRTDGRTWLEDGPIDEATASFLRGAQVDRLVVADASLSPNPLPVTLAQPFDLAVRPATHIRTVAADPGLAAHFLDPDPVLAAHQLLADLTVLYLDRPGQTRGVVVQTPRQWAPDASFLQSFLDGLTTSPLLAPVTLDTLFSSVAPATSRGVPLVRTLVPDPQVSQDVSALPVDALRATRRRLDAFGSALTADNPLYGQLDHALLVAGSSDLADLRQHQGQIDRVNRAITGQLSLIQLPSARTITLTAHTGRLPVTILSGADYQLRVVLRVESDKLSFPGRGTNGTAIQTLDLHRGNNVVDFTVRARTAGSFPLHITLLSPDQGLTLAARTFTIQSTALAGVGLFLSAGAALFLAVWWGRHAWRGRRARKLVGTSAPPLIGPASSPAPAGQS